VDAPFGGPPGTGGGIVDGRTADALAGRMRFPGTSFVPALVTRDSHLILPDPLIAPVTVMGHVTGLHQLSHGRFPPVTDVFDVFVTGTGTVNLRVGGVIDCPSPYDDPNCKVLYNFANWSYSGTAVVVPEPATILLLATGLVCIGARLKVPRRSGMRRAKPVPSLRAGRAPLFLCGPDKKIRY